MKRKTNILFIILIVSSLFLILIPKSVLGSVSDIQYSFENDVFYNSEGTIISYTDTFNVRNPTNFTHLYNSSYSFTNEIVGTTSTDIMFINYDLSDADCFAEILNDLDGHNKILEVFDDNGAGNSEFIHVFDSGQVSGTLEFWWQNSDTTINRFDVNINDGTLWNGIDVAIYQDDFLYFDGIWNIILSPALDDTWYQVRIDFECGGLGYLGLAPDTFKIHINGIEYGAYDFRNPTATLTNITLWSGAGASGWYNYFDGFGFSWLSNYTIRDNLFPITEINNNILEMSRYEFAMETNNTLYSVGSDEASGWENFDDGNDNVNIIADPNDINDRVVEIDTHQINDIKQWRKLDFTSTAEFINITAGFDITTFTGTTSYFGIVLVASDTVNPPAGLYVFQNGDLQLETGTGYHTVRSDVSAGHFYEVNMFLNYEIDIFIVQWFIDGILDATYEYTMVNPNLNGLSKIYFYNKWIDNQNTVYVDYCGVYESGISIAEKEYAWTSVDFGGADWDLRYHNLYTIRANGLIHMSSVEGIYTVGMSTSIINDFQQFNNVSTFVNTYDNYVSLIVNPTFVFTFNNSNFNVYNITIEGVRLIQESNRYNLIYTHNNIDTSESYFYVDLNNRLQFTLITNDTDTEYIQATFDIPNLSSTDKAISFRGSKTDLAFGYFIVDYLIGVSTVDIPIFEKTTRAILPTNKTIDNIGVLISDNDVDTIVGTTYGFVSNPKFLAISGIGLPIITAGLIEMMIPLIMIIIPTLLISKGFGKEGKKLIIPLFSIFSLITTATLIIPIWIFFIIIFGTGLFLARNKEIGVDK